MPEASRTPVADIVGVGLIAAATLLLEVVLTRIFAVTFWYYFGALAISLAMLGMTVAALVCFVLADRSDSAKLEALLPASALAFAVLAPLGIQLHLSWPLLDHGVRELGFYPRMAMHLIALFAIFLAGGLAISAALYLYRRSIGKVYCGDLVGAAIGSLLVVPVLYTFSAPSSVFVISAVAAASATAFAWNRYRRRTKVIFGSLVPLFVALAFANQSWPLLRVQAIKSYDLGQLQRTEREILYEGWSPISRVTVHPWQGTVLEVKNDGAAPTYFRRFDGDWSSPALAGLQRDVSQLVQQLRRDADVLVIGAGGGLDVLSSLYHGQRSVDAVEINPVTYDLVLGRYADYIGNIFNDPRVSLTLREGRNYVAGSDRTYDLIVSNMIDSWGGAAAAAGAFIFSENTLYTQEAVSDYLAHLRPNGILSMSRHWRWDDALRLVSTYLSVLENEGIDRPSERIIVATERQGRFERATVLLKNGTFTPGEIETVRKWSVTRDVLRLVHVPFIDVSELWQDRYAGVFRRLIASSDEGVRDAFVARYRRNLEPSTDDRPFHFFATRFFDSFGVNPGEHPSRWMALPILYAMFLLFLLFGISTLVLPAHLTRGEGLRAVPRRHRMLSYFALLGAGYLLVEVSLLHRLTVFLGHPIYSFVVVLSTMLLASGIGSFVADRFAEHGLERQLSRVLAVLTVVLLAEAWAYGRLTDLMWLSLSQRILVAVAIASPPAFLMGFGFPLGIRLAGRTDRRLVPWGWGVNGAFSVLAPIAALVFSLNLGLRATLLIGTLCYAFASLFVRSFATSEVGAIPAGSPAQTFQARDIVG